MPSPDVKGNQITDKSKENQILSGARAGEPKSAPLKLPQLTAQESVEPRSAPANENETLVLRRGWERRRAAIASRSKDHLPGIIMFCGAGLSAMWLAAAVVYVHNSVGWKNITNLMPHEIGGFLAGLLAPMALFWMVLTFWLRSVDVKLYADALRHEIQAMIFPSDEAEKRVNNDIDRLMRQTAEMSRATRTALSTLQQARQAMQGETQAMKDGAEATADRLEKLEEQLMLRSEKLDQLQSQFGSKGQFFMDASSHLVQQAALLDQTVRQTSETSAVISQTLKAPIHELEAWQNEVVQALDVSAGKIAERQADLRVDVKAIEEKSRQLAETLKEGTSRLYDFTDDAVDKAKLIETRLQGQGLALEQVLGEIGVQADKLSAHHETLMKQLQDNAADGRRQMVDNATLLEGLLGQMGQARVALNDTIQGMGQTTASSVEQLSALGQRLQKGLQDAAAHTEETVHVSIEQLTLLGQRLQKDLQDVTARTEERTRDSMDSMSSRTAGYIEQFGALVTAAAQNATEQSQALLSETRAALMKDQTVVTGTINDLLDANKTKMAETAVSFTALRDQVAALIGTLADRQHALDKTGQNVASTADAVNQVLQSAFDRVMTTTASLERGIVAITAAIEQPMLKLEQGAQQAHDQARTVGDIFEQKIMGLNLLSDVLGEQARTISHDLGDKSRLLQSTVTQVNTDMTMIRNALQDHTQTMEERIKAVMSQVTLVMPQVNVVNDRLSSLTGSISHAGDAMSVINNTLITSGENLIRLSDEATLKIRDNLNALDQSVETTRTAMTGVLDDTTTRIKRSMHDLSDTMASSGKVVASLSEETVTHVQQSLERFVELGQAYQAATKVGIESFAQGVQAYHEGVDRLQDGSQRAVSSVAQATDSYQTITASMKSTEAQLENTRQAMATTTQSLTDMQNTMARVTGQIDAQTGNSIRQVEQLQQLLNGAHDGFVQRAATMQDIAQRAEAQAHDLIQRTQAINEASVSNNSVLEKTAETLRQAMTQSGLQAQQVNDFNRYVAELNQQMNAQKTIVIDQATALERAAQDAMEKAKTIRDLEIALQRDHFFSAAKFVVESLHSLALDFTRMLDGELPEKTWRSYQRGETSVFARRLVSMRDSISHDKLRQKFTDDIEFRTYVQRYWRQFEEMHEQAKRHDHGDLLSSVFVSSDVGRLYQLLQDILKPNT